MIGLRIPDELTAKIDKYASQRGISRSAVIREVLEGAFSKDGLRRWALKAKGRS